MTNKISEMPNYETCQYCDFYVAGMCESPVGVCIFRRIAGVPTMRVGDLLHLLSDPAAAKPRLRSDWAAQFSGPGQRQALIQATVDASWVTTPTYPVDADGVRAYIIIESARDSNKLLHLQKWFPSQDAVVQCCDRARRRGFFYADPAYSDAGFTFVNYVPPRLFREAVFTSSEVTEQLRIESIEEVEQPKGGCKCK